MKQVYLAIDLKSFYASVECADRGLNPLTTNLVVADKSRTDKTICLAVSPSLKALGLKGRERLFSVEQKVKEINNQRLKQLKGKSFTGKSSNMLELKEHPNWAIDFVTATPRMRHYIEVSTEIYQIYLKYIAPEDIHVYSIDEVFIDATNYLNLYQMDAEAFARKLVREVYDATNITATAGIGTNLYLCKVAMDIVAKHMPADSYGVRIASLDVERYRQLLWNHQPLTDFWRVGRGIGQKLNAIGIATMGDIARLSLENEDILFRMFGINAELLIDHAWGCESTTMADIKSYHPDNNSISTGQVLSCGYSYQKALIVAKEMAEALSLELVEKKLVTNLLALSIGYDSNEDYHGPTAKNYYGKVVPKKASGTIKLEDYTSSTKLLMKEVEKLFSEIVNKNLLIKRIHITACIVIKETLVPKKEGYEQLSLFKDSEQEKNLKVEQEKLLKKEKDGQNTILKIKKKYGKNAIIKGIDLSDGATTIARNDQIGGHKA